MKPFDHLINLLKSVPGAYMCAEMTSADTGDAASPALCEYQFRPGAGAHNVYSISKSVTGCAIGILESEKRIRDTDTVYSYLGKYFPENYDRRWEQTTVGDLMIHRSGAGPESNIDVDVTDFRAEGIDDFLAHVLSCPVIHEHGKGPFVYCDTNYYLVGRVVEEITGMTCGDFLQERLFNPLGWIGNAWGTCPGNHTLCGTGLFVRARDLAAYGYMLASGGTFGGRRLLDPSWIEKARGARGCYGYGFTNSPDGRWFSAGGMYGQCVYIIPAQKTAFCVLGHEIPVERISAEIIPLYLEMIPKGGSYRE